MLMLHGQVEDFSGIGEARFGTLDSLIPVAHPAIC
jgi:hypothetical protein